MYKPPSDNVCTSCKGWKPKNMFCCGRKKCLEYFRSFPKGKGYSMTRYESESGVPVHKLGLNIKLEGGMYVT